MIEKRAVTAGKNTVTAGKNTVTAGKKAVTVKKRMVLRQFVTSPIDAEPKLRRSRAGPSVLPDTRQSARH